MSDIVLDSEELGTAAAPLVSVDISRSTPAAPATHFSTISLGIICPMASEQDSAVRFVEAALNQCRSRGFKSLAMFVVLDHACKDNTRALLDRYAEMNPDLMVVWAPENRGVVDGYLRGYRAALDAGCDWILEIDAGFSHDPAQIPSFLDKMSQGYDCVFGSRFCPGGSIVDSAFKRKVISKGGSILANLLLGTKLNDMTSGYEMFSRKTLEYVLQRGVVSRGPFFQTEIKTYCRNLKICEIPICYRAASHDVGKSALKDSFKNLWRLFRMRRSGQL